MAGNEEWCRVVVFIQSLMLSFGAKGRLVYAKEPPTRGIVRRAVSGW